MKTPRTFEGIMLSDKELQEYNLNNLREKKLSPDEFVKRQLHLYDIVRHQIFKIMNKKTPN